MQNLVYAWFDYQISKFWLKFKTIWIKSGNYGQNLTQNWIDWGSLSSKIGVNMGPLSYSQWHVPTKTKVESPHGLVQSFGIVRALSQIPVYGLTGRAPGGWSAVPGVG